jgi:hypothetical protein
MTNVYEDCAHYDSEKCDSEKSKELSCTEKATGLGVEKV